MPPQRLKSCPHGPMCHIEFVSQEASWERLDCSVHAGSWRSWGQNWRWNWRLLSSNCSRKLIARPIANLKKLLGPLGLLGPVAMLGQPFLRESGRPHQGHGRGFCCQAGKVLARALDTPTQRRGENFSKPVLWPFERTTTTTKQKVKIGGADREIILLWTEQANWEHLAAEVEGRQSWMA